MKSSIFFTNAVLLSLLCINLSGWAESATKSTNPAADYLPKVVVDEYNPDRAQPATPHRGGKFRARTPVDFQHLNVITATGQPEQYLISFMSDSLVDRNQETLEYYPEIAWMWSETDLIQRKDGKIEEGRIVEKDDTHIVFVPGAWRHAFGNYDVKSAEGNTVTLTDQWSGTAYHGRVTELGLTTRVDEGHDSPLADKKVDIPLGDLATYTFHIGSETEERPFAKEGTAFRFHIRPGVTWSDGAPFTARDVKFSYDTIMNPGVDSQSKRNYYQDVTDCVVSDDDMTVTFHYGKTYFQALAFLGGESGSNYLIPEHIFNPAQYGGDEKAFGQAFNDHEFKEHPVYTGPYKLKEWNRGNDITLVRNEDYWKNKLPEGAVARWAKGRPYFDEITWVIYRESAAAIKDLQRGVIDADFDVEPSTWKQTETNTPEFLAKITRNETIGFLYTYIGWNELNPIFADKNVRKAMTMLIPRDEIAEKVHGGVAFPTNSPFYVNGPGNDPSVKPLPHDPREARRLLARAGWLDRDGDGILEKEIGGRMVPLEFRYSIHNARDYHQKIADIVKENIEKVGARVTIDKTDWTIFSDRVRDKNFDAVRFAWGTTLEPDPFQIWHSSQADNKGDNFVSYKNDRVDELCVAIRETLDPLKRWEMAKEMHRLIYEDQPYTFLFCFYENYFVNRKIRGVKLYPDQYKYDLTEWYWSEIPENRR